MNELNDLEAPTATETELPEVQWDEPETSTYTKPAPRRHGIYSIRAYHEVQDIVHMPDSYVALLEMYLSGTTDWEVYQYAKQFNPVLPYPFQGSRERQYALRHIYNLPRADKEKLGFEVLQYLTSIGQGLGFVVKDYQKVLGLFFTTVADPYATAILSIRVHGEPFEKAKAGYFIIDHVQNRYAKATREALQVRYLQVNAIAPATNRMIAKFNDRAKTKKQKFFQNGFIYWHVDGGIRKANIYSLDLKQMEKS